MAASSTRSLLLALTAIAAPAALGLETVLRWLILPPEMEELRALLRDTLTPIGWTLAAISTAVAVGGVPMQARLQRRALARQTAAGAKVDRDRAVIGAFLVAASVVQVPAIMATLAFMLGSAFLPVGLAVGVSTVGVVIQATRAR